MKNILGSLIFLSLSLFAKSEYDWKVSLDTPSPYLHQASVLSMECSFSKEGKNDDVEFTPPTNTAFEFKLLSEKKHFKGELQTLTYKYLVFARKVGSFELVLKPIMLFTTQSAIDNVIEGRDNINDLEVEKEVAMIPAIKVTVLKTLSSLTGKLSLETDLDLFEVSAYEPVHFEVVIEGIGNLHNLEPLSFEIEGVEVFVDTVQKNYALHKKGYKGIWLQRFAFVGIKDFMIPSIKINYFDLESKTEKTLETKPLFIKVKVDGIKREDLIDKVNLPSTQINWEEYLSYVYYLLIFLAGFLVAKLVKIPKKTRKQQKGEKIKKAKTSKELLEVLVICDKSLFCEEIKLLENDVYKNDKVTLTKVKKSAKARL